MASDTKLHRAFVILNDKGLHTRPATELVRCAQSHKADIFLSYQGIEANAKSLLSVLMLAATRGAKVEIEAYGSDAEDAINAIVFLARNKFNVVY